MQTINAYESVISQVYDKNLNDIKTGFYGKFIKDNENGTYIINDGLREIQMKIEDNDVVFCNTYTTYPCKWVKSLPIVSIKDLRHEQLYFENRTQIPNIDGIFESPNYFKVTKDITAEIIYMTPMEYIKLCSVGFGVSFHTELERIDKDRVKKYAHNMLDGDLFPLPHIVYHKDGSIDQEGRHRTLAVQFLIDSNRIPKDTEIPVVIVTEVDETTENLDNVNKFKVGNIYYIPFDVAWKMRAKWAYPGTMEAKRTDITMSRIESGMKKGRFDPIPVTYEELKEGVLTEGKHRLIIAKKLGIKEIPILIIPEKERIPLEEL